MSDSNTPINPNDGASTSTPFQVVPPPAHSQARTAPRQNGSPAPGRKPLFRR
jgi:hypothetical protein